MATFFVFILLFIVNFGVQTNIGQTQVMWLVLTAFVFIASVTIIIKDGFPSKKYIVCSLAFSVSMFIAYLGISFTSIRLFIVTGLTALATFTVFERFPKHKVKVLDLTSRKVGFLNILLGTIVGVILGTTNLFLSVDTLSLDINLSVFLTSLSPAIFEEIALRLFLFALSLYVLKGTIKNLCLRCPWGPVARGRRCRLVIFSFVAVNSNVFAGCLCRGISWNTGTVIPHKTKIVCLVLLKK